MAVRYAIVRGAIGHESLVAQRLIGSLYRIFTTTPDRSKHLDEVFIKGEDTATHDLETIMGSLESLGFAAQELELKPQSNQRPPVTR